MRLLFVLPFSPDPGASHGGGAYLGHLLPALAAKAEVGVIALLAEEEMGRWQSANRWSWSHAEPRLGRGRGARGLAHRLRMLWRWRHLPLVAAKHWQPGFVPHLARARREFRPDVVLVELAQMAQYLPSLRGVPTVLTDHEAGCPANTTTGLGAMGDRRDRRLWQHYVRRFYGQADLLQAVTTEDADALSKALGRPVWVRPPTIAVPVRPVDPATSPPRVLFLGDYRHGPNREAAQRLAEAVLPALRARVPATQLLLAGSGSELLSPLQQIAGVRLLGFVPDLTQVFADARLLLAPVWSGGGFRMKTLTALAHGLPVVTNTLGARGIDAPAGARRVADDIDGLVTAALPWLADAHAAAAAGAAGRRWVQASLAPEHVADVQLAHLEALLRG